MILLLDGGPSPLILPDLGLLFWTTIAFILFWTLLGKFAFKPITSALKKRETDIDSALKAAEEARAEMANLKADNERILNQAKEERAVILKEAKEMKDNIIEQAKEKAKEEAARVKEDAMSEIENQRMAATIGVKNLIGGSSVDLAKQILQRELKDQKDQESFIESEIAKMNLS